MLFGIIFCFFTVFGIVQLLALLWEMFFATPKEKCVVVVSINESTDVNVLWAEFKMKDAKIIFVYDGIDEKKLEILKKDFEFASFVTRDNLSNEIIKLI